MGSTGGGGTTNPAIRAVMFTRFEDVEGYVVSASDPPNVMTDQFKDIGYQFLPDKGICWNLISVALGSDYRMIGVPVHIEDARYRRRAFVFCFCLLVENSSMAIEIAKRAAQELAEIFHSLEIDPQYHLLSSDDDDGIVVKFLRKFRRQLNEGKRVDINVVGDYWIQFDLPHAVAGGGTAAGRGAILKIEPWYIPISIFDIPDQLIEFASISDLMDLCDGERTIGEVSVSLDVDFGQLSRIVSRLVGEGLMYLSEQPIDEFSRVKLTSVFHSFFDDLNNRQEAVSFVTASGIGGPATETTTTTAITNFGDYLVRLYCKISGQNLGEFSSIVGSNISINRMVLYGLVRRFLEWETMFPVYPEYEQTMVPVLRLCDGSQAWDAIGYKSNLTRSEMIEIFNSHQVLQIWR